MTNIYSKYSIARGFGTCHHPKTSDKPDKKIPNPEINKSLTNKTANIDTAMLSDLSPTQIRPDKYDKSSKTNNHFKKSPIALLQQ